VADKFDVGAGSSRTGAPSKEDLARTLGNFAVEMENQSDAESVLRTIVAGAVVIVPGVRWAGISLISGNAVEPRVPSDPVVAKLDSLQSELNQGPCMSALREHRTVHISDMSQPSPWPQFAAAASALGVRSSLSFQLFVRQNDLGALNLYAGESGVFDDESIMYGEILAQHAAVALAGSQAAEQFEQALASRDMIGQAKGILMERFKIDNVRAFAMLARLSQESNTRLAEIARLVIERR
jgi:GAF domain-containing protein